MKVNATKIEIDGIEIIKQGNGNYFISIDPEYVNKITLNCIESGKPGIIGPDVQFTLQSAVKKEIAEAEENIKKMYTGQP